jgi:hypothetical protein
MGQTGAAIRQTLDTQTSCSSTEEQSRAAPSSAEQQWGELAGCRAKRDDVGPACMPLRAAVVPNKGGRGIEHRTITYACLGCQAQRRPAFQGTSCYLNLSPSARHCQHAPADPIPLLFSSPSSSLARPAQRRQPLPSYAQHSAGHGCDSSWDHSAPPGRQPRPSPADRVWVEVLSLALARLGSSTVTRGRSLMCTQQMGARLKNDYSGIWLPGPVLHA